MRQYYPLRRSGKKYRRIPYSILNAETDGDSLIAANLIDCTGSSPVRYTFNSSVNLMRLIKSLPSRSWVISYDIDYMTVLLYDTMSMFSRVEAVGEDTNYMTLRDCDKMWSVVDIRPFLSVSLENALIEFGQPRLVRPEVSDIQLMEMYSSEMSEGIKEIWERLVGKLKDEFNIYPSRSPGTTALKIFSTTVKRKLKPRGAKVRKAISYSIKSGALHWKPGIYENAYMYDINASYPFAMRIKYPLHVKAFSGSEPPTPFWIATVTMNYECNQEFSPLHVPTVDGYHHSVNKAVNFTTSINYIDYNLLNNVGKVEITDWIEGICWDSKQSDSIFADWSVHMEEISGTPEGKILTKIVSRALHSKFHQANKPTIGILRTIKASKVKHTRGLVNLFPLSDGKWGARINQYPKPKFRPYDMPEYESLTLAMGRSLVYSAVDENTIYVDTDCIISTVERDDLFIGTGFGQWKLAHSGRCAIAGPRMYAFEDTVKASGIRTDDIDKLKEAIWKAASGKMMVLNAIERFGVLDMSEENTTKDFTVRQIKYPYVEVNGEYAYVTRSPTQQVGIIKIRQELI